MHIVDPTAGKWAFRVSPAIDAAPTTLQSVTIQSLILNSDHQGVDFVKLDIEGAEKAVFSSSDTSWLDAVQQLIVETHDHLTPECTETVLEQCDAHGLQLDRKIQRNFFFNRH